MKDAKEFHGKTLDDAIMSACEFYGVEREKLEIEIVNDSKMGIFGLVNVKKACVRAALANTPSFLEDLTETLGQSTEPSGTQQGKGKKGPAPKAEKTKPAAAAKTARTAKAETKTSKTEEGRTAKASEGKTPQSEGAKTSKGNQGKTAPTAAGTADRPGQPGKSGKPDKLDKQDKQDKPDKLGKLGKPENDPAVNETASDPADSQTNVQPGNGGEKTKADSRPQRKERAPRRQDSRPRRGRNADRAPAGGHDGSEAECGEGSESFALADLEAMNQEELLGLIHDVINRLVGSIIGEVPLTITIEEGHIRVKVDCDEDARILVGREGQTLASVQYIASRILAGKLNGAVRLHIDTGNYKENQDARLTSLAQMLAEKLRKTGRTQSTRPLSAYQRRIVHMALESEEDIQTSSKGDGPQRRVLIHFKRNKNQRNAPQPTDSGATDTVSEKVSDTASDKVSDTLNDTVNDTVKNDSADISAVSEAEDSVEETVTK